MNAAFVAARAVHFGATMLVFGELVFFAFVAGRRWRDAAASPSNPRDALERHTFAFLAWALAASIASGAAWLLIEASEMAGTTIAQALRDRTAIVVLRETEFGRAFTVRALFLVALIGAVAWMHRARRGRASRIPSAVAASIAAALLATLADAGHAAAAANGTLRVVHLGADAAHLLAAGAWLGALPPLVLCIAHAPASGTLERLARRFSMLGIACVGILIATGIVNALLLVGSFAALFGTSYGQLLDVKLALFAAMLAIAAVNRGSLTPRLAHDDAARRALARNARREIAAGIGIVAVVAALGTMVPGAHQSPRWPFDFALDPAPPILSAGVLAALGASAALALAAIAFIIAGVRRKALRWSIAGCAALLAAAAVSTSIFAVPAFPTTFTRSPVPYTVDAIAHGSSRFAELCSTCHGADARGDGPAAPTLAKKPANLAEHALHHPEGNLFWWIAHGIAGSPMPGFSPQVADEDIWAIVQFVVARASADAAATLGPRVDPASMSRAPDFAYTMPGEAEQTLAGPRTPALLVLYATQDSAARLAELAADHRLMHANLRVIPVPLAALPSGTGPRTADGALAEVYSMFTRGAGAARPTHVELLVDGAGIVRARWTGIPPPHGDRDAEIAKAIRRLPAPGKAPASMHHGHG